MISKFPRWVWVGGGVLAFSAGMTNAIAFLSVFHQAATHMTGIFSHLSISLLEQNRPHIYEAALSILFFLAGAVTSGIIIRDAHLQLGRSYGQALALESGLLFLSALTFQKVPLWGAYLACMASGLQNALASNFSGAILRTTHLTGIVTDLGVLIGHKIRGANADLPRIKLFSILIFSFTFGGYFGALFHSWWNVSAMFAPAVVIGASAAGYTILRTKQA
jgi:uncharacterized membrane protein YoaK (UPF0700 family)